MDRNIIRLLGAGEIEMGRNLLEGEREFGPLIGCRNTPSLVDGRSFVFPAS